MEDDPNLLVEDDLNDFLKMKYNHNFFSNVT